MSTTSRQIPSALDLTHAQRSGWACVWCGASLAQAPDAVLVGKTRGSLGTHVLDGDVYGCSTHTKGTTT